MKLSRRSRLWRAFTLIELLVDIQPDRHRAGGPSGDGSSGPANYLFADGHASALQAAPLKQRIQSGDNFAKPQP